MNGYKLDEQRVQAVPVQAKSFCTTSFSSAGHARADPLIAIGQRPEDCGARAVDLLLGGTAIMVSFADGEFACYCAPMQRVSVQKMMRRKRPDDVT